MRRIVFLNGDMISGLAFRLIKNLRPLFPQTPFMALTATATPKVLKDISNTLGLIDPKVFHLF